MGNKKETSLEFAATILKMQLEDSLSIIGHKILTDLEDEVSDLSDEDAVQYLRASLQNPFILIEDVSKQLKEEYSEFSESDECREMVEEVINSLSDDPDVDEVVNSINRITNNEHTIDTKPSKKLQ